MDAGTFEENLLIDLRLLTKLHPKALPISGTRLNWKR
jgi:hypothetical protein